jgi:hypothetical protein
MTDYSLTSPVALLIFNRPALTEKVFRKIAAAAPPKLLIVADGPRPDNQHDREKCIRTREVVEKVDWDCEVLRNYSEVNLGCKQRVSSGLDWVFQTVDRAIVLEDDCLPHPTFFRYCEELLTRYADDERIGLISGYTLNVRSRMPASYFFSMYPLIWGWASWSRAWKHYDVAMSSWPAVQRDGWLKDMLIDGVDVKYWERIFQQTYNGIIDTWDYQWTYACWTNSFMTILPRAALISNLGFGGDSTHTRVAQSDALADNPVEEMTFPLCHPPFVIRDYRTDQVIRENAFNILPPLRKNLVRLRRILRRSLFRAR